MNTDTPTPSAEETLSDRLFGKMRRSPDIIDIPEHGRLCFADALSDADGVAMPDVRSEKKVGESGVEAFDCNSRQCWVTKNEILAMAGLPTDQQEVDSLLNDLVLEVAQRHAEVGKIVKQREAKMRRVESLLLSLGYDIEGWSEDFAWVWCNKDGVRYEFGYQMAKYTA